MPRPPRSLSPRRLVTLACLPAALGAPALAQCTPPAITVQPQGADALSHSAVILIVGASGTGPLSYQWFLGNAPLSNGNGYSGVTTDTLTLGDASLQQNGWYHAAVTNACGFAQSGDAQVYIHPECYANCDESTTPPVLNVLDFNCFINSFFEANPYANCDASWTPPMFNINDFNCFVARYAQGCEP